MARAYSRSQGRIIEIPDDQIPKNAPLYSISQNRIIDMTQPSQIGKAGVQMSEQVDQPQISPDFKKAALLDLMTTGGKNLGKIATAQKLISPETSEDVLKEKTKTATDLRKELRQEVKDLDFKEIRSSYDRIINAQPTAAGDTSLIFSYMKLLDPTSVVREGEQASAENTRGVPESVRNLYNKVVSGRKLTDRQREEFKSQADVFYNKYARRAQDVAGFYSGLAQQQGVDPQEVIGSLGDIKPVEERVLQSQKQPVLERLLQGAGTAGKSATSFLFGGTKNILQDVISTPGATRENKANQNLLKQGEELSQMAVREKDPNRKKQLLDQANEIFRQTGTQSQQVAGEFSPSVETNPLIRGIGAGFELYSAGKVGGSILTKILQQSPKAAAAKIVKEGASNTTKNKVVKVLDFLRKKTPTNIMAEKQAAAAAKSTVKPNINNFVKAGNKISKTDTSVAKVFSREKRTLKNIKNIPDLLDHMQEWGSKTYSKSGGVNSAAKSRLYNQWYQEGLNVLKSEAPEVYENRQLLRATFQVPKTLGKVLWRATLGKILVG